MARIKSKDDLYIENLNQEDVERRFRSLREVVRGDVLLDYLERARLERFVEGLEEMCHRVRINNE